MTNSLKALWRGTGGVWPEGPHLYKVNGKYYLMTVEPVVYQDLEEGEVELSTRATPLEYEFFCRTDGDPERRLGVAATRDLSSEALTAQPGAGFNFTGVYIGMYATGNGKRSAAPADFDWFEYLAEQPE